MGNIYCDLVKTAKPDDIDFIVCELTSRRLSESAICFLWLCFSPDIE
jgi:hypothetical protein